MCPPTTKIAKCVSNYLGIMKNVRKEIDKELNPKDPNLNIKHKVGVM